MKRFSFGFLVAAATLAISVEAAQARCAQRDLRGEWQFYNSFAEPALGSGWSRCLLSIDGDCTVASVGSCVDFDGATTTIADGLLTVTAECVVTGAVTVDDGGFLSTAIIEHATMDSRGSVIHGVGRDQGSLPGFSFHMIKK